MEMENLAKNIDLLIPIIKEKEYQIESFVMGYHMYRNIWSPKEKDILNTQIEPSNVMDRFAVVIKNNTTTVGHLPKYIPEIALNETLNRFFHLSIHPFDA